MRPHSLTPLFAQVTSLPGIGQVYVFENRGAQIGVTLQHPHGQIYAYPYVTPRTRDLLAQIDDGDYQVAVDAAKAKIATQDATITRFSRQIDAQGAAIAQAAAQVDSSVAQIRSAEADVERSALEFDRSQKLAQSNYGSQQRLEQATADRDRMAAALSASKAGGASTSAALQGARATLEVVRSSGSSMSRQTNRVRPDDQRCTARSFTIYFARL